MRKHNQLLTIAMIVKNELNMLSHTIKHLKNSPISLVFLDTGSTDNTVKYLISLGAKVHFLKNWDFDFSIARNKLLSKITTPWVLFLDADEFIETASITKILDIISKTDITYFKLPIYQNSFLKKETNTEKNYRIKLFRTDQGFKYIRPVNEKLDVPDPIDQSQFLEIPIYHWGNDQQNNPEKYKKKIKNYIKIFKNTLKKPKYQHDSMLYFQIGRFYEQLNNIKKAYHYYFSAIKYSSDIRFTKFMYYYALINNLQTQNKQTRVIKLISALESRYKTLNQPIYLEMGRIFFRQQKFDKAKKYFQKSLIFSDPLEEKYSTYSFETKGYFQLIYLGFIAEIDNDLKTAETLFQKAQKLKNAPLIEKALQRINNKKGATHG